MPVLVISALAQEQAALRKRLGVGKQALVRAKSDLWLGLTQDGPARAEASLRRHLEQLRGWTAGGEGQGVRRIVVIGLGGGLSPGMDSGRLVEGSQVLNADGGSARALQPVGAPQATPATLISTARIVARAQDKQHLWRRTGAWDPAVVDLESWAFAQVAAEASVPLSVLRVVSDGSDEDLPSQIAASSGDDGSVRQWQVALRAAVAPRSWSGLVSLKSRVDTASERLAKAVLEHLSIP